MVMVFHCIFTDKVNLILATSLINPELKSITECSMKIVTVNLDHKFFWLL